MILSSVVRLLIVTLALLSPMGAFSDFSPTNSKYTKTALPLSKNNEFVRNSKARDFWKLIPHYRAQETLSSCSVAAMVILFNAIRSDSSLSKQQALLTEDRLLDLTGNSNWTEKTRPEGGGVSLSQLFQYSSQAFYKLEIPTKRILKIQFEPKNPNSLETLRNILIDNEKSEKNFIVANFDQGIFTQDEPAGHFSIVGAFDFIHNQVLILDSDRDWYEPYWVSLELFYKGVTSVVKSSGKRRGIIYFEVL